MGRSLGIVPFLHFLHTLILDGGRVVIVRVVHRPGGSGGGRVGFADGRCFVVVYTSQAFTGWCYRRHRQRRLRLPVVLWGGFCDALLNFWGGV